MAAESRELTQAVCALIGGKSLLQASFERVTELAGKHPIWTVASEDHRFLVRDEAEAAKVSFKSILEPMGRNTAAAMAAAALNAEPGQLLLFLPADHHVPDAALFSKTIEQGVAVAERGAFVTFGVTPFYPHTGYGYIQVAASKDMAKPIQCFVEKPNQETALTYLMSGDYYWNAGVFLVRADALIQALKQFSPDILESTQQAVDEQRVDGDFIHLDPHAFAACRSESIDYAVLEPLSQNTSLRGGQRPTRQSIDLYGTLPRRLV